MNMKHKLTLLLLIASIGLASCASRADDKARHADNRSHRQTTPAPFDADSAYAYVAHQVSFGPRVPGTAAHTACADWIASQLRRHGADTVIIQQATVTRHDGKKLPIRNIMGQFNPSSPTRVLLAAHWDTRPWADADDNPSMHNTPIPGANDGGSGVGVLLEIARQLGLKRPDIGVDLLMVDAEDSGISGEEPDGSSSWCLGTQHWVENHPYTAGNMPRYAIVLDMVGGTDARFHRELVSQQAAPAIVDKVWALASAIGHGDTFVNEPGAPVLDDHVFINGAGIPAIDIIENRNPATGSFTPVWHTMADDMSSIDRRSLRAAGETTLTLIYNEKQ